MKIKQVHLVGDALPGISTRAFAASKGDEFALGMGCVFVTTGVNGSRRVFALPLSGVRLELHELPDLGEKPAAKK